MGFKTYYDVKVFNRTNIVPNLYPCFANCNIMVYV